MSIKNVVLVGASGCLGVEVFKRLAAASDLNLKVLRRNGSTSTFPGNVQVVDVDFGSVESLAAALAGQDAVVSTISSEHIAAQKNLVEAALSAGVKRFIPSDFGSNLANEATQRLPVFLPKIDIRNRLIEIAKTTDMTYTFVYNGAFLDWGIDQSFLINRAGDKTQVVDGGDIPFSVTDLASVADGVYGVLTHPEETKNRAVYVEDAKVTQNQLLGLAKQAAPSKSWDVEHVALDDLTSAADKRLAQGLLDFQTFGPYLYRAIFGKENGGNFDKNDNALLGVKGKTEEEVAEVVKHHVK
ncbi:putative oxidoreductase - protein [Emericellopsis cladophorae]|uniref:Oxidoreductase - protein n=1 Tax=Emericellopsis cladophorae TaxID=2686198 RepID=A0A9Q0BD32_9HYPO|nr:putative oxidoreductase - protein [Emericellopsis cladophorae]KAI6781442.1 putative oxidoreductase - protein [Emericellopsis cladophorae]